MIQTSITKWPILTLKRHLLLVFLSLIIASCSSYVPDNDQVSSRKINRDLQPRHVVKPPSLVATYDLAATDKTSTLYAPDLGPIINYHYYHQMRDEIAKEKTLNISSLALQTSSKIVKIKNLLFKLNAKYRFLSLTERNVLTRLLQIRTLHAANNISPATASKIMAALIKLDHLIKTLPLMMPEYQPIITSHYGLRTRRHHRRAKFHRGIDLVGHKSAVIYSSAEGVVVSARMLRGYGNIVEIQHTHDFKTRYAHLKRMLVAPGQKVLRGEKIGIRGNTGSSSGQHLHFEILLRGQHINPFDFISHACKY